MNFLFVSPYVEIGLFYAQSTLPKKVPEKLFFPAKGLANEKIGGLIVVSIDKSRFKLFTLKFYLYQYF